MDKLKVFMIMPFTDDFFDVYQKLKKDFASSCEFSNASEIGNQQSILNDIIQPIFDADLVVADLTGLNANVMYELGVAHSLNKKTIIITQDDISTIPFDIKTYKIWNYNTNFKSFSELVEYLNSTIKNTIDGTCIFGNPVIDFLSKKNITQINLIQQSTDIATTEFTDKGYFDFIADIEENVEKLGDSIVQMAGEMTDLSTGVSESTDSINRIKKTGEKGALKLFQKETKKVANYISSFSSKLNSHNKLNALLWQEIEKNTSGLIDNRFSYEEGNKPELITFLKTLYDLKSSNSESSKSIAKFKQSLTNIIGIDKSMTKSINIAIVHLDDYLSFSENMNKGIDKNIEKSKLSNEII